MATSSSAVLPARSPMPLTVHSTWPAPASTAASELATARPRSSWQCALSTTVSAPGHAREDVAEHRGVLGRHGVADGVGEVDRSRALPNGQLGHPAEKVGIGAARVFGGELDVVGVLSRLADGRAGELQHVLAGRLELFPDVEVGRRDEDVKTGPRRGPDGLAGELDVALAAAGQRRHRRAFELGGDLAHASVVAFRRRREAGFHDVDAERIELPGESKLFLGGETVPGGLLAVAQGGVEDEDVSGRHKPLVCG